jgi:formylglycine-generating enzyme
MSSIKMKSSILSILVLFISCNQKEASLITNYPEDINVPEGMVWVPGNSFTMGATDADPYALPQEKPAHPVAVDGFFMDATEVTNAQFQKFINATGYVTTAERAIDWEEMKKMLPEGTQKPHDSLLAPGSLVFYKEITNVNGLENWQQWWKWVIGANWKQPSGPNSTIEGKEHYPVVHISFEDAQAYCKWANRKLPTEAQWELAARGNLTNARYTWGNDSFLLDKNANTWQGNFPLNNQNTDGYDLLAPVKSYSPNSLGLFDMAGNVWEYTADWYHVDYYRELLNTGNVTKNPTGAKEAKNPNNPYQAEKVIKGGSFLCNESYCSSYRISARMGMTPDSSSDHVGFRTIATIEMLRKKETN